MLRLREDPGGVEPGWPAVRAGVGGTAGAPPGGAPSGRRAGGVPDRRVGVLWPAVGYFRERADPPAGYRGIGGSGADVPEDRGRAPGAGPVCRFGLYRLGSGQKRAGEPCGVGRAGRGRTAYLPPEHPPQ